MKRIPVRPLSSWRVCRAEAFRAVPVRLRHGHRSKKTALLGLAPDSDMRLMIARDGQRVSMPPDGLMISTALADTLHVTPGEKLRVEVLEGTRTTRDVVVSGTVDELLGLSAYMNIDALHRLLQEGSSISGAFLQVDAEREQPLVLNLCGCHRIPSPADPTFNVH